MTLKCKIGVVILLLCQAYMSNSSIGVECNTEDYPYLVALMVGVRRFCGGAIIRFNWVLTSAYCVEATPMERIRVKAGFATTETQEEEEQNRSVKRAITHNKYSSQELMHNDARYDIGLLLLEEPFSQTSKVNVVHLPSDDDTTGCFQALTLRWLKPDAKFPRPFYENQLQCIDLPLIRPVKCAVFWKKYFVRFYIDDTVLCGKRDKPICTENNGGPVLCNKKIIGIISKEMLCAREEALITMTRVESYISFITTSLNKDFVDDGCGKTIKPINHKLFVLATIIFMIINCS